MILYLPTLMKICDCLNFFLRKLEDHTRPVMNHEVCLINFPHFYCRELKNVAQISTINQGKAVYNVLLVAPERRGQVTAGTMKLESKRGHNAGSVHRVHTRTPILQNVVHNVKYVRMTEN